ncbi:MAG: ferrous iron transport protein A [Haloferacaceae archaeon]
MSGVERGQLVQIRDVPDEDVRAHLLRIGMLDGPVRCRTRIAKGPVVVERNGTTMALGASVADEITVTLEDG